MEDVESAQESADSSPSSAVEPVVEPPADHQTQPEDAPTGESTPDQQSGDEPQDASETESEGSADAGDGQNVSDAHAQDQGEFGDATLDEKSEAEPSADQSETPHTTLNPTFSMDLEPEVADKLRTLRRLTNGRKSDDELLAQIRTEAETQASSQHKKRRWFGT
jgi:hypothetical protein